MLDRLETFSTSFDPNSSSPFIQGHHLSVGNDDHGGSSADDNNNDDNSRANTPFRPQRPTQMPVHYYEMWDQQTSSIQIPDAYRFFGTNKRTSLEMLQDIIHSKKDQAGTNYIPGNNDPSTLPACFRPNTAPARQLAQDVKSGKVPLSNDPVLYVGFPKTGTTTLWHFFECSGYMASHQQQCPQVVEQNLKGPKQGKASLLDTKWSRMRRREIIEQAKANGRTRQELLEMQQNMKEAHLQLDYNAEEGCYPQIQMLDEIHSDYPNATFILAFRPINEWIQSVTSHHGMKSRWGFFDLPGLIMTEEQLKLRNRTELPLRERIPTLTKNQLRRWWCGHIQHIREFVEEYPSHRLIELDLYHDEETSSVLADIFQSKGDCWSHKNKNEVLANQNRVPPPDETRPWHNQSSS